MRSATNSRWTLLLSCDPEPSSRVRAGRGSKETVPAAHYGIAQCTKLTGAANDLIRHAIAGLLSNEMDPRPAAVLVQLVNCSQRINQHAELEARLEKLERAGNGTAASISEKDSESVGAPAQELTGAGKPRTPSDRAMYAKKAASQA